MRGIKRKGKNTNKMVYKLRLYDIDEMPNQTGGLTLYFRELKNAKKWVKEFEKEIKGKLTILEDYDINRITFEEDTILRGKKRND